MSFRKVKSNLENKMLTKNHFSEPLMGGHYPKTVFVRIRVKFTGEILGKRTRTYLYVHFYVFFNKTLSANS